MGKYGRDMLAQSDWVTSLPSEAGESSCGSNGRLNGDNPFGGMPFTERNFAVADMLWEVTKEIGRSMAEVVLAWVAQRTGVSSVLIGASRPEQLQQNMAALSVSLSQE